MTNCPQRQEGIRSMAWRLGVDIGGTFTDLCAYDEASGAIHTLKVLSQPDRPGADLGTALEELVRRDKVGLETVGRFTHGTTVGVNTIIQRRGAVLALFTTAGFTDVLELARLRMPDAYSLFGERPPPLVPKDRVFPIVERMAADGTALQPVDRASVAAAVAAARAKGCDGVVVAFCTPGGKPAHEIEVARIVAELAPELFVFRSHRGLAGDPRVRAHQHRRAERLRASAGRALSRTARSQLQARRRAGAGADHPLQRRRDDGAQGRRDCVGMLLSGTASRRDGGRVRRRAGRRSRCRHAGHGRHQRRRRAADRRQRAVRRRRDDRRVPAVHPLGRGRPRSARAAARSRAWTRSAC